MENVKAPHAFVANPTNGRCMFGLTTQHAAISCGKWQDAPVHSATPQRSGWSNAGRRSGGRSHPLGEVTFTGDGFTEYSDDFGGRDGTVQIWDNS